MSFATIAALISGKRPVWLYQFERDRVRWFYTSHREDVIEPVRLFSKPYLFLTDQKLFTRTWAARSISHGKIPQSANSYRSEFPITFNLSDEFARSFMAPLGAAQTTVTIWHGFLNDPDGERVVKYKGRIVGAKPDERSGTIQLTCMSELATLDRKALTAVMQRPCRHTLYFGGCGLNLADWQADATASAITTNGLTLTVAAAGSAAAGLYRGGVVSFGGLHEMIIGHAGTALQLAAQVPGLADEIADNGSAAIKIAPGCDLSTGTCASRFSNIENFGGFPHMTDSPFDGRSIL